MADAIDKALGITGAVSGLFAYMFYRYYKNRTETARKVRNIRVWQADQDLYDHLASLDSGYVALAAVEGVVQATGRTLGSEHGSEQGVILKSQLVEHRTRKINGFWSDDKKQLRSSTNMVPFSLTKPDSQPNYAVEVMDAAAATNIEDELDTTHDMFEPHKTSLLQAGFDRLMGDVTKGIQETEQMLLTGTTVMGVGKVLMDRDRIKLTSPEDSDIPFILTKMRLYELVRSFESQSNTFKVLAIVSAIFGGTLVLIVIWRRLKLWLERRRRTREFEEIRRALDDRRLRSLSSTQGAGDLPDHQTCVVCLTNARQIIVLDCGHICLCPDCAEALPSPKICPVCRAPVERFMPVFHP